MALALLALGFCPLGATASAPAPLLGSLELYAMAPASALGLNGFDPVSYFLKRGPRPGKAGIELIWGGVAWRFASEANREAFRADPETYAPRLGGYDPTALAEGRLAASLPTVFAVTPAGLYLFRSEAARQRFLTDTDVGLVAEARWSVKRRDVMFAADSSGD